MFKFEVTITVSALCVLKGVCVCVCPNVFIANLDVCLFIQANNGKLPKTGLEILYYHHLEMRKIVFPTNLYQDFD